ncbi:T9SS type A sorting domain-containing protein [Weeksellaceae bacterium TAE3-ERU29]|nr:T9SS type A sorting domain-containing protein [Weeksellaceae bacterium TAE3-ERU29]
MRKAIIVNFLILFLIPVVTFSQTFEKSGDLSTIKKDGSSEVSISPKYYKDGQKSLLWEWNQNQSKIIFSDQKIASSAKRFDKRAGIKVWIFNEKKNSSPLVFNFLDKSGKVQYTFDFNMNFTGWRAAWVAYSDMWTPNGGKTSSKAIENLEIVSPKNTKNGEIWIDRLEFSDSVDKQATPDAQIPENNRHLTRDQWHWGLLYIWELYKYDIAIPTSITSQQKEDLKKIATKLDESFQMGKLSASDESKLSVLENKLSINSDGTQGAPLMQKDNMIKGDADYADLNQYLYLNARKWLGNKDNKGKNDFIKGVRYMLNQGFAYGSGMGTNHHYGYQTRNIFWSIYKMKDVLKAVGLWEEAKDAATYWSGLQETRKPYSKERDEITDSWNTLLTARLICALMPDSEQEQYRNMEALARWTNGSVSFTPGTLGGIKVDGTGFHHGGHYPAYAAPGYGAIGEYLKFVNDTPFSLKGEARDVFKFALLSLARQTNKKDWGLGVSGRNPFTGEMGFNVITAFGYAAKSYDSTDKELAEQYLRLIHNNDRRYTEALRLEKEFTSQGFTRGRAPQGFYVYNHANLGVYRYNDIMISLKGFSRNLWGAEIYYSSNRFGRYQSYGSAQIIGTPDKKGNVTEEASGYNENGWDWNRNPGTTTIHLPLENLNSPFAISTLRQPYSFSGANDLDNGKYGMFATKQGEFNFRKFTPSFNAHKSVFCFGDKIIFLGSEISNDNSANPTETTLFQQFLNSENEEIIVNGTSVKQFPYSKSTDEVTVIKDAKGYYYYIPKGQKLEIRKQAQESVDNRITIDNRTVKYTNGNFAVAYLDHGKAPKKQAYEYMILLTPPTDAQIENLKNRKTGYRIKRKDNSVHIVEDVSSNARGYAVFEAYDSQDDDYILKSDDEIMIMLLPKDESLSFSVCSPDLNIGEPSYTTANESQPVQKRITLKGKYKLSKSDSRVVLKYDNDGNTMLTVTCKDGIPVEFNLVKVSPEFKISPTTVKVGEFINIEVKDIKGKKTLKLFDSKGALAKEFEIKDGSSKISTEGLSVGVYTYKFISDELNKDGEITIKLAPELKVNPTTLRVGEFINVEIKGVEGKKTFKLFNAKGTLVKEVELKKESSKISTEGLSAGVYRYEFISDELNENGKITLNPAPEVKVTKSGEFINIEAREVVGKKIFKLFNSNGTLVKEEEIKENVSKISTQGLPSGVYRYEFTAGELNKSGEIIIEVQNEVRVYPTLLKSGEPLILEMNGLSGEKQFIIYDTKGALIKGAKIKSNEEIIQFPTHGLVKGVYFYQLSTPDSIKQQGKFIIK